MLFQFGSAKRLRRVCLVTYRSTGTEGIFNEATLGPSWRFFAMELASIWLPQNRRGAALSTRPGRFHPSRGFKDVCDPLVPHPNGQGYTASSVENHGLRPHVGRYDGAQDGEAPPASRNTRL